MVVYPMHGVTHKRDMNVLIMSTKQTHCTVQRLRNRIMDGVTNPDTQMGIITTEIVKRFIRRDTSLHTG